MMKLAFILQLCSILVVISGLLAIRLKVPNLTDELYELFQETNSKIKDLDCIIERTRKCDGDKPSQVVLRRKIGGFTITVCCEKKNNGIYTRKTNNGIVTTKKTFEEIPRTTTVGWLFTR